MSEQTTGATDAQIEAAARRSLGDYPDPDSVMSFAWNAAEMWARHLVPPGYRIVPADAVCITPEIAATAAEACTAMSAVEDGQASSLWGTADDISAKCRMRANNYRAAAAALGGEE